MHPTSLLLPRASANAASPWDERLSLNKDGEYLALLVTASWSLTRRQHATSSLRSGPPASLSGQRSRRRLMSAFFAADHCAGNFLRLDHGPEMRTAAADLLQRFAYDFYPAAPELVAKKKAHARKEEPSRRSHLRGKFLRIARRHVDWNGAR